MTGALAAPKNAALNAGESQPASDAVQLAAEKQRLEAQVVFDSVTDHLRREPAQSTRLLQSWIHTE
jgi:flagellar M-ring protein FliF